MPHKPLSFWISTVDLDDAPIRWGRHIPTNDGDERSDARDWPRFKEPSWRRVSVPVIVDGVPGRALGLRHGDDAEVVVELDDFSTPIPVGAAALSIVNRAEEGWPDVRLSDSDLEVLGNESRTLRHYFVERLAGEGEPGPRIYWLLPWDLLDHFCEVLGDVLAGATREEPRRLRHWFNPVGAPVAPALDQLYEGLVVGDERVVRRGATAFCTTLLELDAARVPAPSRQRLAGLALRLADRDPLLRHVGRRAAARITEGHERERGMRQSSRLPSAASSAEDNSFSTTLDADPFTITATVRTGGRMTIVVAAALSEAEYERAVEQYEAIVVVVVVTDGARRSRFYIPIGRRLTGYSGLIRIRIHAEVVHLTVEGPPLGAAEVLSRPPVDVLPSLADLDQASTRAWGRVARVAPSGHPLKDAIDEWQGRYGL